MSSAELNDWFAYQKRYGPIGPERLDRLVAQALMHIAVMLHRGTAMRTFREADYMPTWVERPAPQAADVAAKASRIMEMMSRLGRNGDHP